MAVKNGLKMNGVRNIQAQWRRQLVGTWARSPWRLREFFFR